VKILQCFAFSSLFAITGSLIGYGANEKVQEACLGAGIGIAVYLVYFHFKDELP